jgi:molybdopterin synthase catalytic subunit
MQQTAPFVDVALLDKPVEPQSLSPFPPDCGAECIFIGRTRVEQHPDHGPLLGLRYQAYRPLATNVLEDLARQAAHRFSCSCVRIHHAVGEVPPGGASVLVQVAAPHRRDTFEACRFVMDQLKQQAPIWKQELWADSATWLKGTAVEKVTP